MIEAADDALLDDTFDRLEILDHAAGRPLRLQRASDRDLQTV
jgi:hypothetical protein